MTPNTNTMMDQPMLFDMEDDYGFYEDLDEDIDGDKKASSLSIISGLSSFEDDSLHGAPTTPRLSMIPSCGSRLIDDNDPNSLLSSPPILSPTMVDTIVDDGLPWCIQDNKWDRLFTSTRDGASFSTFMRQVRGHDQTIIVAKTSDGRIVGGYATDVWSGRKSQGSSDADACHSFLFEVDAPLAKAAERQPAANAATTPAAHTFIPGLEDLGTSPTSALDFDLHTLSMGSDENKHTQRQDEKPHVKISKASQKTNAAMGFKQACQIGNKFISMSDSNSSGISLMIANSFSRGVSRTNEDIVEFSIVEFEVYGFSED